VSCATRPDGSALRSRTASGRCGRSGDAAPPGARPARGAARHDVAAQLDADGRRAARARRARPATAQPSARRHEHRLRAVRSGTQRSRWAAARARSVRSVPSRSSDRGCSRSPCCCSPSARACARRIPSRSSAAGREGVATAPASGPRRPHRRRLGVVRPVRAAARRHVPRRAPRRARCSPAASRDGSRPRRCAPAGRSRSRTLTGLGLLLFGLLRLVHLLPGLQHARPVEHRCGARRTSAPLLLVTVAASLIEAPRPRCGAHACGDGPHGRRARTGRRARQRAAHPRAPRVRAAPARLRPGGGQRRQPHARACADRHHPFRRRRRACRRDDRACPARPRPLRRRPATGGSPRAWPRSATRGTSCATSSSTSMTMVGRRLAADPVAAATLGDLVAEACANAVVHGGAGSVSVTVRPPRVTTRSTCTSRRRQRRPPDATTTGSGRGPSRRTARRGRSRTTTTGRPSRRPCRSADDAAGAGRLGRGDRGVPHGARRPADQDTAPMRTSSGSKNAWMTPPAPSPLRRGEGARRRPLTRCSMLLSRP
jgi:hypothetical protein